MISITSSLPSDWPRFLPFVLFCPSLTACLMLPSICYTGLRASLWSCRTYLEVKRQFLLTFPLSLVREAEVHLADPRLVDEGDQIRA